MLTQKALPVRGFFVELSTQFTYNLLYWYKSTNSDTVFVLLCTNTASAWGLELGTQFTYNLLYWYNSTNTDAQGAVSASACRYSIYLLYSHTSTKVQILTLKALPVRCHMHVGTQFTGFTGTEVQILTLKALPVRRHMLVSTRGE